MVFTSKHHDGFCMFDSSFTDYKITNTPYGQDIAKQLANACKDRACPWFLLLAAGHAPSGVSRYLQTGEGNWNGEPARPEWPLYLDYMQLQLTELLTGYGPVALIWFDGLKSPGEIWRDSFPGPHPETATGYARE